MRSSRQDQLAIRVRWQLMSGAGQDPYGDGRGAVSLRRRTATFTGTVASAAPQTPYTGRSRSASVGRTSKSNS